MKWNEFKQLTKKLRIESTAMTKKFNEPIWCEFNLFIDDNHIYEINPYCPNLTTGILYGAHNLRTGKYETEINIKELLE